MPTRVVRSCLRSKLARTGIATAPSKRTWLPDRWAVCRGSPSTPRFGFDSRATRVETVGGRWAPFRSGSLRCKVRLRRLARGAPIGGRRSPARGSRGAALGPRGGFARAAQRRSGAPNHPPLRRDSTGVLRAGRGPSSCDGGRPDCGLVPSRASLRVAAATGSRCRSFHPILESAAVSRRACARALDDSPPVGLRVRARASVDSDPEKSGHESDRISLALSGLDASGPEEGGWADGREVEAPRRSVDAMGRKTRSRAPPPRGTSVWPARRGSEPYPESASRSRGARDRPVRAGEAGHGRGRGVRGVSRGSARRCLLASRCSPVTRGAGRPIVSSSRLWGALEGVLERELWLKVAREEG